VAIDKGRRYAGFWVMPRTHILALWELPPSIPSQS
jgi:hypothetical protein